jgi:hypothetical protein
MTMQESNQTTDPRLTAASEYLGYARGLKVADLPRDGLIRLAAELRRQLGQVLGYLGEVVVLGPDRLEVLGRVFSDAVRFNDVAVHCEACDALPGDELCPEDAAGFAAGTSYLNLARDLGIEVDQ